MKRSLPDAESGPGKQRQGFVIIHGLANRRPHGHWQRWLADELASRGHGVRYPQLPDPESPDLATWLSVLGRECGSLSGEELTVVCHSLGCALWHEAARRQLIKPAAHRVFLVAPPGPSVLAEDVTSEFQASAWDATALKASSCTTMVIGSDADPYCPEGPAAIVYGEALGLPSVTVSGAGHFTIGDGFGPWPQMLEWCLGEPIEPS